MTPSTPRAATLQDVAREAGVSLATASRSLNGSERQVAEEYRVRVFAAAEKLSYTPNLSAQAVVRGGSMTLALLVSDIADPYFSSIASGVIQAAGEAGLHVTMAVTERKAQREIDLVRVLRGQRPKVLILAGSRFLDSAGTDTLVKELEAFENTGGRVVMISQRELPFATVLLHNREGAKALAGALADIGYTRFAVLTGARELMTANERLEGFTEGLAEAGIELGERDILRADFTWEGGYAAADEFVSRGRGDTQLVFAVNDVMALGAMAAFRAHGLALPGDIAVAGYDDISTLRDVTPSLTTVRVPLVDVGRRAVELAIASNSSGDSAVIGVITETVLRASTPPLNR